MKTTYFLFILLPLAFGQVALAQNDSTKPRPKAYLFSSGDRSQPATRSERTDSYNNKDASSVLNRPRVYRSEPARPVKAAQASSAFNLERRAFELINQQRVRSGLTPLVWSEDAAKIARHHSQNMANYKFFSHTGLDGSLVNDRADSFGVRKWRAIGENIAYNQGFENPVEFAVERWMRSPKHRDNLLSRRWTESGIGVAVTADGTYYFTEVFLVRK